MAVALRHRDKGIAKVKQVLVMEFHTEVIAGMENRLATIATIVRMGPLLGLLGTVASMIGAFGRIGGAEKVNPTALASDISLALWATGAGLLIATPMMIVGNDIHARLRRLRDRTERQLQDFLEILELLEARDRPRLPLVPFGHHPRGPAALRPRRAPEGRMPDSGGRARSPRRTPRPTRPNCPALCPLPSALCPLPSTL
jgi:hypothetical protein